MRVHFIAAALALAPVTALAQSSSAQANARASVAAHASAPVPSDFSASGRARLEATYARAQREHVPESAIADRVDEGETKGASEHAILAAAARVETNMESARAAMIAAGRQPDDDDVRAGAYAMERGVTQAQIRTMARHAPPNRSLAVALNTVTELNENGMQLNSALTEVQGKLDAHASDAAITSLVTRGKAGVKLGGG